MMYLNQYHKDSMERKLKKLAEYKKSPMNSADAAAYMKRNFEKAKQMEMSAFLRNAPLKDEYGTLVDTHDFHVQRGRTGKMLYFDAIIYFSPGIFCRFK